MMIAESAMPTDWVAALTVWLLTYLLHSTLLLSLTWGFTRLPFSSDMAQREWLWKGALFGGILTATLQFSSGMHPIAGTHAIPLLPATANSLSASPAVEHYGASPLRRENQPPYRIPPARLLQNSSQTIITSRQSTGSWHLYFHRQEAFTQAAGTLPNNRAAAIPTPAFPQQASSVPLWMNWLIGLWLLGASLALVRYVLARRSVGQLLRHRQPVSDKTALQVLCDLCCSAGIRKPVVLSASADLQSPLALPANEICLPLRALSDLERPHLQTMLAHELAHLQRRDPMWLALQTLLQGIFFFQPLNLLACKHLRETSEFLCDDWAVRQTGQSVGLARCLSRVAGWMLGSRLPQHVAAMHHQSPLKRRVARLLDNRNKLAAPASAWRMSALLFLILALFTIAAPSISSLPAGLAADTVYASGNAEVIPQIRTVVNTDIQIHFANRRSTDGQVQELVYRSSRSEITY